MECPNKLDGPKAGEMIRNEKVRVLDAMPPITLGELVNFAPVRSGGRSSS